MRQTQPYAAVVYNPTKTSLSVLQREVDAQAFAAGWAKTQWFETAAHDAGLSAARRAVDAGASVVLAAGGDGTVRAVAEALRGTGVPLAVVPQGTGNLLGRNLGMPLADLSAQVAAAFIGESRRIDLGVMTITRESGETLEHVFLVLAGMGLDARAITVTNSKLKKRVGWLAYVDAGMRTLLSESPLPIRYSVDGGHEKSLTVYSVMIGNCGLLPGGVLLIPDAKMDDGLLDIVALRPLGPFSWLRIGRKIGWENGVLRKTKTGRRMIDLINDTKSVTYLKSRSFSMSVTQPEPIQLDGDDFGLAIAATGSVDPGSLILRVLPDWRVAI